MSELHLDELEIIAESASSGPWKYLHRDYPGVVTTPHGCLWRPGSRNHQGTINDSNDAVFIAAFDPPTVLELIGRVRAAEVALHRAERELIASSVPPADRITAAIEAHDPHPHENWCRACDDGEPYGEHIARIARGGTP